MFRKTALARSLSLAFGAAALVAGINTTVLAQTSVTGNIFGDVASPAGTSVVIEQIGTGSRRTITPDATGRYLATSLTPGTYRVLLMRGNAVQQTKEIEVFIGQGSELNFGTERVQTVEVVSRRQTIDVSTANTGVTFTAAELEKLPVARDVGAVIQLAPSTTRGDTRYGGSGAPSFGGASAAENAFHINGFPVTNVLYMVGFSQLPFGSIAQTQILTGGYSVEFGRSTGGVVNITTKSGTNNYEAGVAMTWTPKGLRSRQKNSIYPNNGTSRDGLVYTSYEDDRIDTYSANAYISGPIVKDKLFFYYNAENTRQAADVVRQTRASANAAGIATAGFQEMRSHQPRSLLKLDWNITQDHHLEYTNLQDQFKQTRKYFGYDYVNLQRNGIQNGGIRYENSGPTPVQAPQGADLEIFKYTGYLTDNLTLTALQGWSTTTHQQLPAGYNPFLFQIEAPANAQAPQLAGQYIFPQPVTGNLLTPGARDKQKAYRIDLEYKLPWRLAGQHTLRGGVDGNVLRSIAGNARAGGGIWRYGVVANPATSPWSGVGVAAPNTVAGNAIAQAGYYVERDLFSAVSTPTVKQTAKYIEDRWQVHKDVLLTLGVRAESFDNQNGDGVSYIEKKNQIAPRAAATWDVNGNASLKVFGTAGRYHLPLPTNVAVRGAGSSLFTHQFFAYTGIDPVTGAPTGLTALGPAVSANNEFGQATDARTVAAKDIKSHYQDELTLGFEKALTQKYNIGAKFTYRKLKSTIDDFCDGRPFDTWYQARNGGALPAQGSFVDFFHCALFNPGQDNRFTIDVDGDGVLDDVSLTKEMLGYPKPKRKYTALDVFLEHPLRDRWYGKVNYTYARNRGNTEGLLLSDIGQADVATTQVFDFPEISVRSDGPLPTDRKHQIKAYGFYELTPEWGFGLNMLAASGRPKNCLGLWTDPNSPAYGYGPAFFSCGGVPTSRGSAGRLPWDVRFDLSATYKPQWMKGLQAKIDVFNLFNRRVVETIEERRHVGTSTVIRSEFNAPLAFTTPRFVRFSVMYDHKF